MILTSGDLVDHGQVESEPELWINAGKSFAVPIEIREAGVVLKWEFTTQPKVRQVTRLIQHIVL
jgi:hypothetical protein